MQSCSVGAAGLNESSLSCNWRCFCVSHKETSPPPLCNLLHKDSVSRKRINWSLKQKTITDRWIQVTESNAFTWSHDLYLLWRTNVTHHMTENHHHCHHVTFLSYSFIKQRQKDASCNFQPPSLLFVLLFSLVKYCYVPSQCFRNIFSTTLSQQKCCCTCIVYHL